MRTFTYTFTIIIYLGILILWGALDANSLHHQGHIMMNHAISGVLKFWLLFFAMLALKKSTWRETWPDVVIFVSAGWIVFDLAFNLAHPLIDWYWVGVTAWTDVPFRWLAGGSTILAFVFQMSLKCMILMSGIVLKIKRKKDVVYN